MQTKIFIEKAAIMGEALKVEDLKEMLLKLYKATGAPFYFDEPFVGVASANDTWFSKYKTVIGQHHWTPQEALNEVFPDAQAKSVFVWIMPVQQNIRDDNKLEKAKPASSWAAMRSFGELCNANMREQMCKVLGSMGVKAVAPHLEQTRQGFDPYAAGFSSRWSERHVAFVAGLGTFGLSAGLITERGIAHRIGSIVTDLELPATVRPYGDDPFAWCTHCGACERRCPAHAIGPRQEDRDKKKCCQYILDNVSPERAGSYGWVDLALGCGLCQTGVPCEFKRPGK